MTFDFDPIKNQLNFLKHGFYLEFAWQIEWNDALIWPDIRNPYSEVRMCCLAPSGRKLFFVAFVDLGDLRRIISLRKANSRDLKRYVKNI